MPTSGLPTSRQSWGRQFRVHQSSGLPTLIMKTYFDMFWTMCGKYNRLLSSSLVCFMFVMFWDQFNLSFMISWYPHWRWFFLFSCWQSWAVIGWIEMTLRISRQTKDSRTYQRYLCQKKLKWGNSIGCQNLIDLWIRTIGARIRIRRCQGAGSLGVLVAYGIHFSALLVSHYLWKIFHTIYKRLYRSWY